MLSVFSFVYLRVPFSFLCLFDGKSEEGGGRCGPTVEAGGSRVDLVENLISPPCQQQK